MVAQFTTIGHSNRSLDDFTRMLREAGVAMVVDVRSFPRSRANPQFNIDHLPEALAELQIAYLHCPALGGRRALQPGVPEDLNAMWRLRSFHNYADYALGGRFAEALDHVLRLGRDRRLALMCSEAVWWRCHRRIITDHLLLNGHPVDHLMDLGQITPASPTPGAERTPDGKVVYPRRPGR
ncbi:Protein of unknown function, DUF488 [Paracoccus solventivorans]|uniref:DUF488 domain-containing protein n=1 Tax=Paracoccus solventivorans TaxID=53463 RepID=A0A1M7HLH4_9RHOB|nr:DUF488 domain-containing protein [Paracoccus solventivorans]SHM29372.1 Protein of unknown function, DUF488 [Paracoccus solventivorans]